MYNPTTQKTVIVFLQEPPKQKTNNTFCQIHQEAFDFVRNNYVQTSITLQVNGGKYGCFHIQPSLLIKDVCLEPLDTGLTLTSTNR